MKNVTRHISALALSTLLSVTFAMTAYAKPPHAKGKAKGLVNSPVFTQNYAPETRRPDMRNPAPRWAEQRISYSQAKSIAMNAYPGAQYLDAYLDGNVYTVVLRLPNTKKIKVKIDAVTGRIR